MKRTTGSYTSYTQAVTDAKAGVQEAFTFLYESTYRDKRYIAQKYMHSEADAEDILQEAYVKAWRNLDQLKEAEKFPGWLSLIVSSTALDALRKKKELPFSVLEKESDEGDAFEYEEEDWRTEYQPEHAYTDKETSELLRELLDALSEEQRFCMLMYYVEEHSVAEIAEIIGCSEGTVKSRLNYGRKNLRAKATDMEKKGYTLYSIPPVALLLYLLRMEAKAASFVIPAIDTAAAAATAKSGAAASSASGAASGAGGTASGAAGSATSTAGGSASSTTAGVASTAGNTAVGAASSGTGGAGAAAATATATAAVAAKVAGISLGVKIAAAVLAVAVIGGGGFAAIRQRQSPRVAQEQTAETVSADGVTAELLSATADSATEEKKEEKGEEFPKEDYAELRLEIEYNPEGTARKTTLQCILYNEKDLYAYGTEWYKSEHDEGGLCWRSTDINGERERHYYSLEKGDMLKAMGKDLYQAVIEQQSDVIESVLREQIQKCEREGIEGVFHLSAFTQVDTTDRMPKKLVLHVDDKSIEMDVAHVSQSLLDTETEEEEPAGTALPYWKDENGDYQRVSYIQVSFTVPKEQTRPLTDFLDAIAEEEKKLTDKERYAKDYEYRTRKKHEAEAGGNGQAAPSIDVVGTWYDPTGYSVAVFTFREDGTGIEDLGSVKINLTYTVSGNTLSYTYKGHTSKLTISGDKLVGGAGETFIKK